jgi:Tol biopolymer transport system component
MIRLPIRISVVVAAAAALVVPAPATATFGGTNGQIAFARQDKGIFLMQPDGTEVRRVTTGSDIGPTFAPGGKRISFIRSWEAKSGEWKFGVFVVRTDGMRLHKVAGGFRGWPQLGPWSPDGDWITYEDFVMGEDPVTHDETYRGALYVVHPDGSGRTRLTGYVNRNAAPQWSPDSTRIAFYRGTGKTGNVWVMNSDGSGKTNLTKTTGVNNLDPVWSPDGATIAFDRANADRTVVDLFTMAADGTEVRQITDLGLVVENPQWRPDGGAIAYLVFDPVAGVTSLWAVGADGTGAHEISTAVGTRMLDYRFAWSPDSTQIVCQLDGDVFTMDVATGELTQLTTTRARESLGDWGPEVSP